MRPVSECHTSDYISNIRYGDGMMMIDKLDFSGWVSMYHMETKCNLS